MLDARSWIELHDEPDGWSRAELHRPVRGSSVGWVDEPAQVRSEDAEAAVTAVLAGTRYDRREVAARLGCR